LAALVFSPSPTLAASDDATRFFQAGRAAFEKQDFETALRSFEDAAEAGMSGPAVHFNIGVAAYRVGRYERADIAFQEAAKTPDMAALAHYNLGLVAVASGDRDAALRWFRRTESTASDERLRELAATQLSALAPQESFRNWLGYGAFGLGYDDNVALVADSDVLGVSDASDSFAELQVALSAPLDRPWRFDTGLLMTDYFDLNEFDQLSLNGGARYQLPMGDGSHEIGLQLVYTTLDGDGMEHKRALTFQTRKTLPLNWQLRARYRLTDMEGLNELAGLSGERHELNARASRSQGPWDLIVGYQFEVNEYDDHSLSSKRHQLQLDAQREVRSEWQIAFELSWRRSNYDARENGSENRAEVALAAIRSFSTRWRLIVRYAYADNSSSRAEFDYQRNRLSASVEAVM
jgi:tetratricopeptide (TPR) repeat protein